MLDPKLIREDPVKVKEALRKRGMDENILDPFLKIDKKWRAKQVEAEELRSQQKKSSKGKPTPEVAKKLKELAKKVKDIEAEAAVIAEEVKNTALILPNIPDDSVPVGGEEKNREERSFGEKKSFSFKAKPHWEIGEELGILNFEQAGKISGSRFVVYHGAGAALERALINFMLDLHTGESGYSEVIVFPGNIDRAAVC